jgi:hypothetical protein
VTWPANKAIEQPQLPVIAYQGLPPAPPMPPSTRVSKPGSVPEGALPAVPGALPAQPQRKEMPTQPLVRLPAIDVDRPLPLPILARPKVDRASLDDTTLEASLAAALRPYTPRRTQPVPFAPVNLPDPFENTRTGGLRNPLQESEQPPVVPIRTPKY